MIIFRVPNGRKINKIMSIVLGAFMVIFLLSSLITEMFDSVLGDILFILAVICGAFTSIFLIAWFIYHIKETRIQKKFEEIDKQEAIESGYILDSMQEIYEIPYDDFIKVEKKRFNDFIKISLCISTVLLIIYTGLTIYKGCFDFGIIVYILAIMFILPIILILSPQFLLYRNSLPHKISFVPSQLIIDDKQFYARDITKIVISSVNRENYNSIDIFRTIKIYENGNENKYCIDRRSMSKEACHYKYYAELVNSMKKWGRINQVTVVVNYMD